MNYLGAIEKWAIWSPDIENAFSRADGFSSDVLLRAATKWDPSSAQQIWKLHASAYGLSDVPVAFYTS